MFLDQIAQIGSKILQAIRIIFVSRIASEWKHVCKVYHSHLCFHRGICSWGVYVVVRAVLWGGGGRGERWAESEREKESGRKVGGESERKREVRCCGEKRCLER